MAIFRLTGRLDFPPPHFAEEDGLLAVGGDLRPDRLIAAYEAGIFTEFGVFMSTNYESLPTQLPSMLIFLLLVLVLIVKPQGLLGQAEVGGH